MTDKLGYPQAAFGGDTRPSDKPLFLTQEQARSKLLSGEAWQSAKRLIDHFFRNQGERPRASIPAQPDYDDDLIVTEVLRFAVGALSVPAPAQAWRVKPLEWEDFEGWGAKAKAMLLTSYIISKWSDGRFEVTVSAPGYGTGFDGERFHPTIEAAKAAAQADYDARILAALIPDTEGV